MIDETKFDEIDKELARVLDWESLCKARSVLNFFKMGPERKPVDGVSGIWQDGPAPKDGSFILGLFQDIPYIVSYKSWPVGGDEESPPDGTDSGWCIDGNECWVMDQNEPDRWATIIYPIKYRT